MTSKTPGLRSELTAEVFNRRSRGHLPGLAGVEIVSVSPGEVQSRMAVRREVMAPNGFLHAASVVALKANFLGTARDGVILCRARAVHLGRTTQVWDAEVEVEGSGTKIALFRCTQMVLLPKTGA